MIKNLTITLLTLLMSMGAWAEDRKDARTKEECEAGPDIWNEEKQICELAEALFASEVFPKVMETQKESSSFVQSVILFLPKQEGETRKREDVLMIIERNGVECRHHTRVTFLVTLNKDKKITKIESDANLAKNPNANSFCTSKEDFNACIAKPFGWDLSMLEEDKVCFQS